MKAPSDTLWGTHRELAGPDIGGQVRFPPCLTTDCHTHVAGDGIAIPFVTPRAYTPSVASPREILRMMDSIGIARVVIVQMSVYGTDNRYLLEALGILGERARGVIQIGEGIGAEELDSMHARGVRGVRINLNTTGQNDPGRAVRELRMAAEKCARNDWHIQLFTTPQVLERIEDTLRTLPVPIVFDHFGLLSVRNRGSMAEQIVRELLAEGRAWVKLSGTYRLDAPGETDAIAALARDLYEAGPEQVVWGSDWPHTPPHANSGLLDPAPQPYRDIDPRDMLRTVAQFFDATEQHRAILEENPARLYDF